MVRAFWRKARGRGARLDWPHGTEHPGLPRRSRNADILIWVNGALNTTARPWSRCSTAASCSASGVWEGLRIHQAGRPSGRAPGPPVRRREGDRDGRGRRAAPRSPPPMQATLAANGMTGDGVRVRLMVTRGVKRTPWDPRVTVSQATVVIIAEWKTPKPRDAAAGPALHRARYWRGFPTCRTPSSTATASSTASPPASRPTTAPTGGADAGPARLRGHLQLDPLLRRAQGRGLDLDRRPGRHHAPTCCASAAKRASRHARRTSASPRPMARKKPS